MGDAVLVERRGATAEVTLNRPDNRNAMTPELLADFGSALDEVAAMRGVRAMIIAGTGTSFCSGADFRSTLLDDVDGHYDVYAPFLRVLDIDVPVIAAMSGHAVGGGFGLSLLCDIRIATADARYGANFVRLGLSPGMAISYLLPRLVGLPLAMEYLLTGRLFDGATGLRIGYANHAVPAAEVLPMARGIADQIVAASPAAVRITKRMVRDGLGAAAIERARTEATEQTHMAGLPDFAEGVAALLERRSPVFADDDTGAAPDSAAE